MKNKVFILFVSLLITTACSKDPQHLRIHCPADFSIELYGPFISLDSLLLPVPEVHSECADPDLQYKTNLPQTVTRRNYKVVYTITNSCGETDTCSFMLNVEDYRKKFLGTYIGTEKLSANYGQQLISETTREIVVSYASDDYGLIVDEDEITITSTGTYPYPTCCGYRSYGLRIWSDSISISKVFGPISSAWVSSFKGRRI